jgi:hypothetical protein
MEECHGRHRGCPPHAHCLLLGPRGGGAGARPTTRLRPSCGRSGLVDEVAEKYLLTGEALRITDCPE